MAAMLERLLVLLPGPRALVSLPIRPLGSHVMCQAVVVFGFANWKKAFGSKSPTAWWGRGGGRGEEERGRSTSGGKTVIYLREGILKINEGIMSSI